MESLLIGLMSGTSLDGVDAVLARVSDHDARVLAHASAPFPAALRTELLALNASGTDELHRASLAGNQLARIYAELVWELLSRCRLRPAEIAAIGAHGQTVRHRPLEFDASPDGRWPAVGYTIQLNNPSLLAELTGIDVVADFRSRDLAAGGQGAPLVPLFHRHWFGKAGADVAVLNIGGIANLSVLSANGEVLGFDCGPGNVLLDGWTSRHLGQAYDQDGAWGAGGTPDPALLETLLAEPFFRREPPKSTGRDLFNLPWLDRRSADFTHLKPVDVQATLVRLTAESCAHAVKAWAPECTRLIVCGGGALNTDLMTRLRASLPSAVELQGSQAWGLPPLQVEATAFAWLAWRTLRRETGSIAAVTGARGARVLGAIYPR